MEAKCLSKAQRLSLDLITTLPQAIIETILCLLPIEEAARTSILSRKWRYKWTKIPKLVFDWSTGSRTSIPLTEWRYKWTEIPKLVFNWSMRRTSEEKQTFDIKSARKNMDRRCKLFNAIHQVLLLRRGPINEFTLFMDANRHSAEIDQIILHLSINHALKKLKLVMDKKKFYKLPLCAFSLDQLTDLDLCYVDFDHRPIFNGFRNLRTLSLHDVKISTKFLLHLLSNCPSLTSFILCTNRGNTKKDCTIIQLFECLTVIEHLDIFVDSLLKMLILDAVPKELPIVLTRLKYLSLKGMRLYGDELCFLAILIKCSPNLKIISLQLDLFSQNRTCFGILEEYSDVWLEHLNELWIENFSNLKLEMEFVKFILVRSPNLKKTRISTRVENVQKELEMLEVLLRAPRVSTVEIVVA